MKIKKIAERQLLYHSVHGLCQVEKINEQSELGTKKVFYTLVPRAVTQMKARFIIPAEGIEASGFHEIVSHKEAEKILDYFRGGNSAAIPLNVTSQDIASYLHPQEAWGQAQIILTFSDSSFGIKDQRRRLMLERSVKGLVGEIACTFKITIKEAATKVQESLSHITKINRALLLALSQIGED